MANVKKRLRFITENLAKKISLFQEADIQGLGKGSSKNWTNVFWFAPIVTQRSIIGSVWRKLQKEKSGEFGERFSSQHRAKLKRTMVLEKV